MTDEEARDRVEGEEDFVNLKRFGFSLKKLLARYPEECPEDVLKKALMLDDQGVEEVFRETVEQMRRVIGV